nr:5-oxoprolinase subunit PxpA [Bifidobacterium tibiigranuli]
MNSDMGESFGRWTLGDDKALLDVVTSANIACGFHAGDPAGILRTASQAAANHVCIGAHVAYRDLSGFGRRFLDEQPEDLKADIIYQIAALAGIAASVGTSVSYVKPHGALYNRIAVDETQARAVVDAIAAVDSSLGLLTLPGSVVGRIAVDAGLHVFSEAFADRAYMPDGRLVPRSQPGAVIHDVDEVADRIATLVLTGTIEAVDGTMIRIDADSICVHGDSPSAVDMARAVRSRLESDGITVASFTSSGQPCVS